MNSIPALTFLRFILAMVILIFHFGKSIPIFSYTFFKNIISCGNSAVSFFFILSGFIMVIANTDNRNETKKIVAKDYYKKRFARIYPLYFLSLILYLVFCNDYINNSSKLYSFLSSLFLIQAWIPKFASDFNFPGWSLSVEVFFYLIFPFFINKIRSYATFKIAVFVTLFWLSNQVVNFLLVNNAHIKNLNFIYYFPLFHLPTFFFGILTGVIVVRNKEFLEAIKYKLLSITSILVFLVIILIGFKTGIEKYHHSGLFSPVFALIIICLNYKNSYINKICSNKIFTLLGESSYGLYIIQIPFLTVFTNVFLHLNKYVKLPNIVFSFYCMSLTLVLVSIIIHLWVEKPANNYFRKILN